MLTEMELTALKREAEKDTIENYALLRTLETIAKLRATLYNLAYWERNVTARGEHDKLDRMTYSDDKFREFVRKEVEDFGQ